MLLMGMLVMAGTSIGTCWLSCGSPVAFLEDCGKQSVEVFNESKA